MNTQSLVIGAVLGLSFVGGGLQSEAALLYSGPFQATFSEALYTGSRTVQVPQFDSSLGILQSVQVRFSPTYYGHLVAQSAETSPGNFNGWALEFTPLASLSGPGFTSSATFPYYNLGGVTTLPHEVVVRDLGRDTATAAEASIDSSLFGSYTGGGTVTLRMRATLDPDFAWSRGGDWEILHYLGGTAAVVYGYTPVPEPATAAATGMCLLVGGLLLRRRQ